MEISSWVTVGTPPCFELDCIALAIARNAGWRDTPLRLWESFAPTPLLSKETPTDPSSAPAACTAAARHSDAKHRVSPRTPASRVYPLTTVSIASAPMESRGVPAVVSNPCSSKTLGTTCCIAMCSFSSAVYPGTSIISMRSRSGPGIVRASFAVARNVTRDKSNGTPR